MGLWICDQTAVHNPGLPFNSLHPCNPCNYMDYYSFTHPQGIEGWVGLVGWPIVDTLHTKWSHVNHRSVIDQEGLAYRDAHEGWLAENLTCCLQLQVQSPNHYATELHCAIEFTQTNNEVLLWKVWSLRFAQNLVQKSVEQTEKAVHVVNELSLFADNEDIDEIATSDLRFDSVHLYIVRDIEILECQAQA